MNRRLDLFFNNHSMLLLSEIIIVISIGNILLISTTITYLEKGDHSFSNFAYGQSYLQDNKLPNLLSAYDNSNNDGNHSTALYLEKLFTFDLELVPSVNAISNFSSYGIPATT